MQIYKGRVIQVYKEKRLLPNGVSSNIDVIRHPGAVLIVPFLDKNKIVLLKQFRPVINRYIYELPAGTIDQGETPLACAKREIIEETGYRANVWAMLGYIYPVPGYSTEKILIYKAEGLTKKELAGDSDEIIERLTATRSLVRQLLKKKQLVDAKTIAALCFCKWL